MPHHFTSAAGIDRRRLSQMEARGPVKVSTSRLTLAISFISPELVPPNEKDDPNLRGRTLSVYRAKGDCAESHAHGSGRASVLGIPEALSRSFTGIPISHPPSFLHGQGSGSLPARHIRHFDPSLHSTIPPIPKMEVGQEMACLSSLFAGS